MATVQKSVTEDKKSFAVKRKGFLSQVKEEMGKVSWTSKEELRGSTKIVLIATFALGFGIYLVDLFLRSSLDGLANIVRMITG